MFNSKQISKIFFTKMKNLSAAAGREDEGERYEERRGTGSVGEQWCNPGHSTTFTAKTFSG